MTPWYVHQSDDNWNYVLTLSSITACICIDTPLSVVSKDLGAIEVT